MSDIADASRTLMVKARELDDLSKHLTMVERELGPLEAELTLHEEGFEASCWDRHVKDDEKLPPKPTREALARRSFDDVKYTRILALRAARTLSKRRISDLNSVVDAQRSIVSALKLELEASRGRSRSGAPTRGAVMQLRVNGDAPTFRADIGMRLIIDAESYAAIGI